jgi:hypothetical protein
MDWNVVSDRNCVFALKEAKIVTELIQHGDKVPAIYTVHATGMCARKFCCREVPQPLCVNGGIVLLT